jgi:hypothetical protein
VEFPIFRKTCPESLPSFGLRHLHSIGQTRPGLDVALGIVRRGMT